MDVCSKIFSCILNERLYRLLGEHGVNTQFGATPEVGCQDGSFTLKTLLHLRRQHNLPTFIAFVDLVIPDPLPFIDEIVLFLISMGLLAAFAIRGIGSTLSADSTNSTVAVIAFSMPSD